MMERRIKTKRLEINCRQGGDRKNEAATMVHGNLSSSFFYEQMIAHLSESYFCLAPDLRGFGATEGKPVDATAGLDDMADDCIALLDELGIDKAHLIGHSMGGGVIMKMMLKISPRIISVVLINPISPYGFTGSKDVAGAPCFADGAPAGAGAVNSDFTEMLKQGKTERDDNPLSPYNVIATAYVDPSCKLDNMDDLLKSALQTKVGEDNYPGDVVASENWPGSAPGARGVMNAMARKYFDASGIVDLANKPPILWIRSDKDTVISDQSFFDIAHLGSLGLAPGWPGNEVCPAQPMVKQTRAVLNKYADNGGRYREYVVAGAGHTPFLEKPDETHRAIDDFLSR